MTWAALLSATDAAACGTSFNVPVGRTVSSIAMTRTSVPSGHTRDEAARTAASAPGDPSTPIVTRMGAVPRSTTWRATSTDRADSAATCRDTLPRTSSPDGGPALRSHHDQVGLPRLRMLHHGEGRRPQQRFRPDVPIRKAASKAVTSFACADARLFHRLGHLRVCLHERRAHPSGQLNIDEGGNRRRRWQRGLPDRDHQSLPVTRETRPTEIVNGGPGVLRPVIRDHDFHSTLCIEGISKLKDRGSLRAAAAPRLPTAAPVVRPAEPADHGAGNRRTLAALPQGMRYVNPSAPRMVPAIGS